MKIIKIKSKKIFLYLVVVVILIALHFIGVTRPLERIIIKTLSPLTEFFYSSGFKIRDVYSDQVEKVDYESEINRLEEENKRLVAENASLKFLEDENEYLKKQIDFQQKSNYNLLVAEIVSRNDLLNNSAEEKSIIINRGTDDGIDTGSVVLSNEGLIVGKIIEARPSYSRACLSVDKKCKFAVTISNGDKTSGVAEGVLGLTIKMDLIPQTEILQEGDIVVSSGLENNIPRGLVLGEIVEVIKENNNLWQNAVIEPLVDFDDLILVSVVVSE